MIFKSVAEILHKNYDEIPAPKKNNPISLSTEPTPDLFNQQITKYATTPK